MDIFSRCRTSASAVGLVGASESMYELKEHPSTSPVEQVGGILVLKNNEDENKPPKQEKKEIPMPANEQFLNFITINVSGQRYRTLLETLERFPETLLGNGAKRAPHYNAALNEYFFERHRPSFDAILYFYQSNGFLGRPANVPPTVFDKEIRFFQLTTKVTVSNVQPEGSVPNEKKPSVSSPLPTNDWQLKIWLLTEDPGSSPLAHLFAIFSITVIVISTTSFCLETMPELAEHSKLCQSNDTSLKQNSTHRSIDDNCMTPVDPFFIIESMCIIWFSFEFVLHFISCPSKVAFTRSLLNWVDFIAILPFYLNLLLRDYTNTATSLAILRVVRLVRVFRIFKLSRHSRGLQVLGRTFRASVHGLLLLVFFLVIEVILFSSAIYVAESTVEKTKFVSIPASFWYSIVTLTTLGYGDLIPVTPIGKVVGGCCAVWGLLVLALPLTVIASNFKKCYEHDLLTSQLRRDASTEDVETDYLEADEHSDDEIFSPSDISSISE